MLKRIGSSSVKENFYIRKSGNDNYSNDLLIIKNFNFYHITLLIISYISTYQENPRETNYNYPNLQSQ